MNEDQLNTIDAYDKSAEQFVASIAKLSNYNHTYDYLIGKLNTGDTIIHPTPRAIEQTASKGQPSELNGY